MNRDLLSKEVISQVRGEDTQELTSGSYRAATGRNPISRLLDYVSGVFTPILPAMIGAGMVKVIILVLISFGLLLFDPQVYTILTAISDGIFYFYLFSLRQVRQEGCAAMCLLRQPSQHPYSIPN
ncbi:hypothetical protein LWE69_13010 [Paenibacillus sp. UKAQ_18]|nr:hypothetical protein [Paenibacillus sp. UKAQ_18]